MVRNLYVELIAHTREDFLPARQEVQTFMARCLIFVFVLASEPAIDGLHEREQLYCGPLPAVSTGTKKYSVFIWSQVDGICLLMHSKF